MNEEQKIIRTFFKPLADNKESLELKNDAAFLFKKKKMIITTDMLVEDIHFDKRYDPEILARKLFESEFIRFSSDGCFTLWLYIKCSYTKKKIKLA